MINLLKYLPCLLPTLNHDYVVSFAGLASIPLMSVMLKTINLGRTYSAHLGLLTVEGSSSKATFSNSGIKAPLPFHPKDPPRNYSKHMAKTSHDNMYLTCSGLVLGVLFRDLVERHTLVQFLQCFFLFAVLFAQDMADVDRLSTLLSTALLVSTLVGAFALVTSLAFGCHVC